MIRVTIIHTTVVIPVLVRAVLAKSTGPPPLNRLKICREITTTNEVSIAEISLQALIRHQYQRSR